MTFRVARHMWWDEGHTRLVPTGDPAAAQLAYPAGTEVAETEARRVGLLVDPPAPAEKQLHRRPHDKMASGPAQNKGATP